LQRTPKQKGLNTGFRWHHHTKMFAVDFLDCKTDLGNKSVLVNTSARRGTGTKPENSDAL